MTVPAFVCLLLSIGFCAPPAHSAVSLARIFSDGMVIQQGMPVPVWGWAKAGENVTVSFAGQQRTATADATGRWMVRLDAMSADKTPRELTAAAGNTVTVKNVLVGEVWLCSGQSNMQRQVNFCINAGVEQTSATNTTIREFFVNRHYSPLGLVNPMEDVSGQWTVCSPGTVGQFSAVGYFFARQIATEVDVPVGIISSNWSGTYIEPWTPPEGFRLVPELKSISQAVDLWVPTTEIGRRQCNVYVANLREWIPRAEAALAANRMPPPIPELALQLRPQVDTDKPTYIYNAMIAPLIPCAMRGVLWYQGESNESDGLNYFYKMKALIGGWRQLWNEGDFPFYYVQLPNYYKAEPNNPAGGTGWAELREAQTNALSIPNTGMACTIDLGDAVDIHPRNKQDVGKRAALVALAKTYGRQVVFSGPVYKSHSVEGDKIRVTFGSIGGGLIVGEKKGLDPVKELPGGKLKYFAVAGEDKVWRWADATIDGASVLLYCERVPKPVAVRYAYCSNPEGANFYNKEGLPAVPFRTDKW